ncbi:conserved hypothetical protein [Stigmatella aurantiaca DW4/3-1]|uniref:Uncharacterized protein n=1 Tax=Stigmatella aurantiaca (strain DW4/3-1) TaxID=378806 RepID=Q08US9_STIAD|nr:conserved hypothetical protein [Stigmatella aurantiaca DW4/3-1]
MEVKVRITLAQLPGERGRKMSELPLHTSKLQMSVSLENSHTLPRSAWASTPGWGFRSGRSAAPRYWSVSARSDPGRPGCPRPAGSRPRPRPDPALRGAWLRRKAWLRQGAWRRRKTGLRRKVQQRQKGERREKTRQRAKA